MIKSRKFEIAQIAKKKEEKAKSSPKKGPQSEPASESSSPTRRMAFRANTHKARAQTLIHFWPPETDPFDKNEVGEEDEYLPRSLTPECDLVFRLDKRNFIEKLIDAGMADPLLDTAITVQKALGTIRTIKMCKDIYPEKIMTEALHTDTPPKMIFLPDRELVRYIIKGLVTKEKQESDDDFMLKYGYCNPRMCLCDKFSGMVGKIRKM